MNKYVMQKSSTRPDGWVLTDTENKVVITFDDGLFNESQKVTLLEDSSATAEELAHIVGEMGGWATRHHGSKCFRQTYGYEISEDGSKKYLYRRNYPRWRLELQEENMPVEKLASSLRKAAEFLTKRNRHE
ncbi:DNA breaking-rejoining protein [Prevotella histicola]|uniref:DNA breaking-rejoining protein n=1 Tax=Prevotella histicola TaxID=470565 RepID=UPI00352DA75F